MTIVVFYAFLMLSRRYYFPIVIDNQWIKGGLTYNMDRGRGPSDDKRNLYIFHAYQSLSDFKNISYGCHFCSNKQALLKDVRCKSLPFACHPPFITICDSEYMYFQKNKLASLEATLVRNSAHSLTHLLTDRGKV